MSKGNKKTRGKTFQSSPFKRLKGVAVAAKTPLPEKKAAEPQPIEPPLDDTTVFQREMNLLGVQARPDQEMFSDEEPLEPDHEELREEIEAKLTEDELFLSSMGQMDQVFCDDIPLDEETGAAPRRMRQLRQGKRFPEAKLDLHGLNRTAAREKVRFFLEDSTFAGFKTVLIITGRGKGSAEGPVLRQFMERYLSNEARAWVVEWGRAPARLGGEGALVVFLKGRRNR